MRTRRSLVLVDLILRADAVLAADDLSRPLDLGRRALHRPERRGAAGGDAAAHGRRAEAEVVEEAGALEDAVEAGGLGVDENVGVVELSISIVDDEEMEPFINMDVVNAYPIVERLIEVTP